MDKEMKSEGKCLFCSGTFKSAGINRHLKTHLKKLEEERGKGLSFLLKVDPNDKWSVSGYFLYLWVDGKTTIETIDDFLRDIWLECCGHLSAFRNAKAARNGGGLMDFFVGEELLQEGKVKEYEKHMEETIGEIPMRRKAKDALWEGLKLEYEYDFGSSTRLTVTVVSELKCSAAKPVVLLSRNEPLEILCDTCGREPAVEICIVENWDEDGLFCSKCAKEHAKECSDFADYAAMPVVNSPRMGICGYRGGSIDKERDGVFLESN